MKFLGIILFIIFTKNICIIYHVNIHVITRCEARVNNNCSIRSMDVIFESPNLLERANIAKQDAIRACTLDEARNYFEAIQHYDQTITVIDDILKNISCNTVVWENLIVFRQTYNDRMVR